MPIFNVTESDGWYEAACHELGVTITARRLEEIEATARRTALRARGQDATVSIIRTHRKQRSLLKRLAGLFSRSAREGHS